jgi:hypothetical protein
MSESEEHGAGESSFRVIDRRRFAADGSERDPSESKAPSAEPTRTASPAAPASAASSAELGTPLGEPYDEPVPGLSEPTFTTLVLSLSTQALMFLGEIPQAPGEGTHRDLGSARSMIDLLGVLEQKTRGNLTSDEASLLERMLYDLRMRFVDLSRA